jgi:purine-cytosine permease-like protein
MRYSLEDIGLWFFVALMLVAFVINAVVSTRQLIRDGKLFSTMWEGGKLVTMGVACVAVLAIIFSAFSTKSILAYGAGVATCVIIQAVAERRQTHRLEMKARAIH